MSDNLSIGDYFSGNILNPDTIVEILAQIFGPGWAELGLDSVMGGGSESASMIVAVLGAINIIALNGGALMLGWIALSATMGTAHEGQFLGKRFHDIWMPLRSGLSITLLAPVAKGGLCVVQIFGMILIGYSIQFANYISGVGLDYMLKNGGRVSSLSVPPAMKEKTQDLAEGLLKTLVVQHHYKMNQEREFSAYTIDQTDGYTFKFHGPNLILGKQQVLSYVQIPNYSTSSQIAKARAVAIQEMYHTLDPLALSIVTKATAEYDDIEADYSLLQQSIDGYIAEVSPYMAELVSEYSPDFEKMMTAFVDKANNGGVAWLGSYYHTLSRYSAKINHISADYPSFSPVSLGKISDDMDVLLEAALGSIQTIEDQMEESTTIARQNSGSGIFKNALNKITYAIFGNLTTGVVASVVEGDPLASLADKGHYIMGASEAAILIYAKLFTGASAVKAASDSVWGQVAGFFSGSTSSAAAGGTVGLLGVLGTVMFLMVIPLFLLGSMLAIYLPLVPWVIWVAALVGTLLLWIEFLVLMPFWAITFATGEGEGLAGQRSQQGLMLIGNALFRLPLMTTGYLIAMVLIPLIGKVIGTTFIVAFADAGAENIVGIPTMILSWFVFGGFMILQCHVIFGLVTLLPEGFSKFFGSGISSMGEAQHEAKTRAMIMTTMGKGEQAGQAGLGKHAPTPGNLKNRQDSGQENQATNNRSQGKGDLAPGEIE